MFWSDIFTFAFSALTTITIFIFSIFIKEGKVFYFFTSATSLHIIVSNSGL